MADARYQSVKHIWLLPPVAEGAYLALAEAACG
jgi:hypothetical protein